jgi:competence ComEA-like helix-hairpin-helix protein
MPTAAERKALAFLGAVALLGAGVRVVRAREVPPPPAADRRALDTQITAVDSARRASPPPRRRGRTFARDTAPPIGRRAAPRRGAERPRTPPRVLAPPLGPFNRLDVDQAPAAELQRLPGIGPALAARIVAYRDSNGPFGSMEKLRRVKGIGPATAARLDSLVRFSGVRPP